MKVKIMFQKKDKEGYPMLSTSNVKAKVTCHLINITEFRFLYVKHSFF